MVTYQVVTMKRGGKDRQVIPFSNGYDATQYATTATFPRGTYVSVVRVEG